MNGRSLSHLSVEDIKEYLQGHPAVPKTAIVQEHYLKCGECLEQMTALAASIDQSQLRRRPLAVAVPAAPSQLWLMFEGLFEANSWALKTVAASLVLLAIPHSARIVRPDRVFDLPLNPVAMTLSTTRTLSPDLVLLSAPKVDLAESRQSKPRRVRIRATRPFIAPQVERASLLTEVALLSPPDLEGLEMSFDATPPEFELPQAAAYRSKPNLFKRVLSAVASSFRTPRT